MSPLGAHHDVALHAFENLAAGIHVDRLHGLRDLLAHDDLGREPHRRADDDPESHLPDDLEPPLEALLVVAEHLDVVVQPADEPQPHGRDEHQLHVDVVQAPDEQHRHQNGHQDDDPAHRRGALLLELPLESEVADLLADLLAPQEVDHPASEDDDDQQRKDDGCRRAERNVLEHARAGQVVGLVEVFEKMVKHEFVSAECFFSSGKGFRRLCGALRGRRSGVSRPRRSGRSRAPFRPRAAGRPDATSSRPCGSPRRGP